MTVLENSIRIQAPPERVWLALGKLDALDQYDPGVKKSEILTGPSSGIGASRQCDLAPGGWFRERVTEWRPHETLAFELFECTLPVKRLKHRYTLTPEEGGTLIRQHMEYELKFGPLGWVMDAMMVRRKWDGGIKSFFAGLKSYLEK
jgi:ligand-binding SRPBCC domain-containing protein